MPTTYNCSFAGQKLELRADRSLWWPSERILFIADLHAGKAEHMQRAGLRIPAGNLQSDLSRLQRAIDELHPVRVIVLGDLFHSDINNEWNIVVDWCAGQQCSIELVRGNHDRFISDDIFIKGGLIVHEEGLVVAPFTLRHHPLISKDANLDARYVLCGHLHPVHTVYGPAYDSLRMPCFVATDHQIILPAYGSFTGGYKVGTRDANFLLCTAPDFSALVLLDQSND